ncbi:MAG TPA: AtpZ/AtpI family protein [Candidatus Limnocylindrales bacterium]|nr:AtpZ/AtpI family protein [Candidatus Limnocylindrales bacterium]
MPGFKPENLSAMLLAVRLALTIVLPLIAALLLGQYLGRVFGYTDYFIIAALILATVGGFVQAIRMLLKK